LFWLLLFCGSQILIRYFVSGDKKAFNIMSLVGISTAVLLILLSGIGQLSGADVVITFCLCIVCSFYFYRSWE
jgi:Ca2+/Na+ antiporter